MSDEKGRILLFVYLICLFAAMIAGRIVHLQLFKGDFYSQLATNQAETSIIVSKGRGIIYDRKGEPLAMNHKVASLHVFSHNVENPLKLIKELRKNGISVSNETGKRILKGENFVWIKRNVSMQKAREITSKLPDVDYMVSENRLYPESRLAAPIIGFTGTDNQGLWGLEHKFDKVLKGDKVELVTMKDSKGNLILFEDKNEKKKTRSSVHLTIDSSLQGLVEYVLREDTDKYNAYRGVAVGMDTATGEILFAASSGGFDPNRFASYKKSEWKSYSSSFLFEPGSILKPVMFSFLLEKYGLDLNKEVYCENGKFKLYGYTIKDVHPYKNLSAQDVLVKSSNIGMIKLSNDVKNKSFYEYLTAAGFGSRLGVGGISEENGLLRSWQEWSGLSRPSLSMGQEILVTPLQVLRFYASVANGGILVKPKVVDKIVYNKDVSRPESKYERLMKSETAETLKKLLTLVVDEGTGQNAKSGFLKIAGKTGTGQRFDQDAGKYSETDYLASFAGFYPADNPKIAMVVIYDGPKTSIYGGSTAAHTFKKLAELISIQMGYKRNYIDDSLSAS